MKRDHLFAGALLLTAGLLVAVALDASQRAPAVTVVPTAQPLRQVPAGPLPLIPGGPLARPLAVVQAVYAMLMFNSGASVIQIRTAIEQKWASRFPSHTPTPTPPSSRPSRG